MFRSAQWILNQKRSEFDCNCDRLGTFLPTSLYEEASLFLLNENVVFINSFLIKKKNLDLRVCIHIKKIKFLPYTNNVRIF